jgi:hypothetical protein
MTSEEKEGIVKEIENAQMLKELEVLIRNLNDDQLDRLEGILTEDEEEEDTEFGRVKQELLDMGIDAQDIEDLKTLAALMSEFLMKIPNIKKKLEMRTDNDLLDNVQLYLLGLPNKLGPLGYISLHHVLDGADEQEDGEIVDVVIEPASIAKIKGMESFISESAHFSSDSESPRSTESPVFRRRRSVADMMAKVQHN